MEGIESGRALWEERGTRSTPIEPTELHMDPPGLDCNNERINRVGGQQDDGALAPADRAILFGPDKARGIAMSRVFAPVSFQLVAIV